MDWKQEAIEKLRDYEANRQALDSILLELERLGAAYSGIHAAKVDGMPKAGSSASTREDSMLSNIVHQDELKRRLKETKLWMEVVDGGLSVLDEEDRLTLEYCYIHEIKGSVDALCERLCLEKSAAYLRHDQALRRFTLALYGPRPGGTVKNNAQISLQTLAE